MQAITTTEIGRAWLFQRPLWAKILLNKSAPLEKYEGFIEGSSCVYLCMELFTVQWTAGQSWRLCIYLDFGRPQLPPRFRRCSATLLPIAVWAAGDGDALAKQSALSTTATKAEMIFSSLIF